MAATVEEVALVEDELLAGAVAPKATLRLHHGSDGRRSGGCRRRTA